MLNGQSPSQQYKFPEVLFSKRIGEEKKGLLKATQMIFVQWYRSFNENKRVYYLCKLGSKRIMQFPYDIKQHKHKCKPYPTCEIIVSSSPETVKNNLDPVRICNHRLKWPCYFYLPYVSLRQMSILFAICTIYFVPYDNLDLHVI